MPPPPADPWSDRVRETLERYAEPLLRGVVSRLVKSRMPPPADELADRILSTLTNPPVIDRRIRDLPDAERKLLALIGLSRRPTWKVGHLVTLLAALDHAEGLSPILTLLQSGLLFPLLPREAAEVTDFEAWLGSAGTLHGTVFALPSVAARARTEDLGLPDLTRPEEDDELAAPSSSRIADGLDWPLRLAVAWQEVLAAPMRLTQGNTLFKRDLTRLQSDEVLTAPAADQLAAVPDVGVLALLWAEAANLLTFHDGELRATTFPPSWGTSPTPTLGELWAALTAVEVWDPLLGYAPSDNGLSPTPSAGFLSLLLVAAADDGATPQAIADWLWEHHPSWAGAIPKEAAADRGRAWVENFLLGVAYPLRLVAVTGTHGHWITHLTDLARHLFTTEPEPPASPTFPQTLLVQPNAEVLAYRQGLTPELIGKLSRFARWKTLGPACTLELTAEQTYLGLETGLTLAGIVQTLNQHGMKPVPPAVADLLQRWANKRERITVFSSATLVEFQTPADLDAAISRGVVSVRVTDRIGLTDDGREPDFKHLRLIGNRDYETKPQQCITVDEDGLTLTVDSAQADLLLEAEIVRIADPISGDPPGVRRYTVSPGSLQRATSSGLTLEDLDAWFQARAGQPLTPAARLFVAGSVLPPPESVTLMVLLLPTSAFGDGLMQWPETRPLISRRLGPTAVAVDEANLTRLRDILRGIGVDLT